MELFNEFSFEWNIAITNLVLLGIAFVLALPIAYNRELNSRSAGLRTYPLVALAACGLMLIGIRVLEDNGAEARVIQGIITGMGFIGGGAILKSNGNVTGLATASSLWATGAMGIAVAWQRFEIALVLSLLMFLTLSLGTDVKQIVSEAEESSENDSAPDREGAGHQRDRQSIDESKADESK